MSPTPISAAVGRRKARYENRRTGSVPADATDCTTVADGYISITPLHLDLTNYASIAAVNELAINWP